MRYYVAVERFKPNPFMAFGGFPGFAIDYFEVTLADDKPVNAQTFYDLINKDKDEKEKTGNVIAWSVIKEDEQ